VKKSLTKNCPLRNQKYDYLKGRDGNFLSVISVCALLFIFKFLESLLLCHVSMTASINIVASVKLFASSKNPDPHHVRKPEPDLHQSEKNPDPNPHQS
jgi:hypothetical protein